MSYHPYQKPDSLNEYFSRLNDFLLIKKELDKSVKDFDRFIIYLHKALIIDARSTIIYLKKEYNKFSNDVKNYADSLLENH